MSKLLCLFLLLLLPLSSGEINNLKIISDSRPMILFERFGFTDTGYATINVSSVSVIHRFDPIDPSRFGFFLLSDDSLMPLLSELQSNPLICVLDSSHATQLFTFRGPSPLPPTSYNHTYLVTSPDDYSLFFANCAPDTSVTMDVRIELYNMGREKNYLSVGLTQLPALYFCFSLVYFAFLGYWIYLCLQNKKSVHKIHLFMGLLVSIKALNILCAAVYNHYVRVSGTPRGWDVLFYIFQFIRGVLLWAVILLVGSGWPFLKPFLQGREKKVLIMVIPLQVFGNVASTVVGMTGPFIKDWVSWNQVLLLVDFICCCLIIVWSVRSFREASKTGVKGARNLSKLMTLFRLFYVVVIGYLLFTRIVVFVMRTVVVYKYQWVANAAEEIADLAFYVIMFYMFVPDEKNEYFVLDEEEKEAAAMPLRRQEFQLST